MSLRRILPAVALLCAPLCACAAGPGAGAPVPGPAQPAAAERPVDLADPTIDTIRPRYDFFVSASVPFGMVALHPDTNHGGAIWNSGYRWNDKRIQSFPHSHTPQTPGVPIMPVVGPVGKDFSSAFSHDQETIRLGYHQVRLLDSGVNAEMTATNRVGLSRYTFPACAEAHVVFDLRSRLADVRMFNPRLEQRGPSRIVGQVELATTDRRKKNSAIHFVADFDRPLAGFDKDGAVFKDLKEGERVQVKVALSFTGIEGAVRNLEAEMPGWDFEAVRAAADKAWNDYLSRIEVSGGTRKERVKFYTDLMHTAVGRRAFGDADGSYPDRHGKQMVVRKADHPMIDLDCLWGAHWNLNPLWTLAYPEYGNDIARTFIEFYRDNGLLGRCIWGANESFTMTGDSVLPLIAALATQGQAKFDPAEAYAGVRKNAFPGGVRDYAGYDTTGRGGGMDWYVKLGYVPDEILGRKGAGIHRAGSGMTLEYAYQDWCLAQMAGQMGKAEDAALFGERAGNWRNVFDTSIGWARPRHENGAWVEPFRLTGKGEIGFVESSAATGSFYVPHDVPGVVEAMGGREAFIKRLEMCFEESRKDRFVLDERKGFGYTDYSNQPGCGMAHLFSHAGAPWKTQYWVREVQDRAFGGADPTSGYNGDEDQGQMGALNVFFSLGLFCMDGCVGKDAQLDITTPRFDRAVVRTATGNQFEIVAHRTDPKADIYIQSATLNGKEWTSYRFPVADFLKGGKLELFLGPKPNTGWGVR